jgi:hypothetical protein
MTDQYRPTALTRLSFDFEAAVLRRCDAYLTLSRKDVLGIVQSACDKLEADDPDLIALKQRVLEDVAEGKLAHALRTAIIGAGEWSKR